MRTFFYAFTMFLLVINATITSWGFYSNTTATLTVNHKYFHYDGDITATFTLTCNTGGVVQGLNEGKAELWRQPDGGSWAKVCDITVPNTSGPDVGSVSNPHEPINEVDDPKLIPNTVGLYHFKAKLPYAPGSFIETSPPVDVTVVNTAMRTPTSTSKFIYNTDATGYVDFPMEITMTPNNALTQAAFYDKILVGIYNPSLIDDGVTLSWPKGNNPYESICNAIYEASPASWDATARYTGLFKQNSTYGFQMCCWIVYDPDSSTIIDPGDLTVWYKLFYDADATNHPGTGSGIDPNWYYYYKQTSANGGETQYSTDAGTVNGGFMTWTNSAWRAFVTQNAHHQSNRTVWDYPIYIDRFAWVTRHEVKHVSQMIANWGSSTSPQNWWEDFDEWTGDYLKDSMEWTYCRGQYNSTLQRTYLDTIGYSGHPTWYILDPEDTCMRKETSPYDLDVLWTNGNANSEDWAHPGKNYP